MTESLANRVNKFLWLCPLAFIAGFSMGGGWEILDFSEWSYGMRHNAIDQSEVISNIVLWSILKGPGLGFAMAFAVLLGLLARQHFSAKADEPTI